MTHKSWLVGAALLVMSAALIAPTASEAKRLGGGKSQGMQRNTTDQAKPQSPPSQQAAPQPAGAAPAAAGATGAAAAAGKRSWMGPIAGLAAGLGLAALMSHLGMGEQFANFLMIALLGVAAIFLVRFLMRRFGGGGQQQGGRLATAGAAAGGGASAPWNNSARSTEPALKPVAREDITQPAAFNALPQAGSSSGAVAGAEVSVTGQPLRPLGGLTMAAPATPAADAPRSLRLPDGFDIPAFERIAKMIFIRMQAANDAGDLDDLRRFMTPEMFAEARIDLHDRGADKQHTDVEKVDAEVIDFAQENGRAIVSVRFHGLVREEKDTAPTAFDEIWHLSKPDDDSNAWAIAGIQQRQ